MISELKQLPREIHKHIRARSYIGSSALGVSDGLFFLMTRRPPISTLFPYSPLFRSPRASEHAENRQETATPLMDLAKFIDKLVARSEEHTYELQSHVNHVCRLLI